MVSEDKVVYDKARFAAWFRSVFGHMGNINPLDEYDPSFSLPENQSKLRRKINTSNLEKTIEEYYKPIYNAIGKVCQGYSHLCFVKSRAGLGKSYNIKRAFEKNGVEPVEITGEVSEAYLYRLIYENNGKPIYLRDVVSVLSGMKSLNLLKSATESDDNRKLTKSNYSNVQKDLPDEFECHSSFVFDYNNVSTLSRKLRLDFEALVSRGDYIEMSFSNEDVKHIMRLIAKDDPEKKKVTEFVINNFDSGGLFRLNLRNQFKAIQTYNYAKGNDLDWRMQIIDELNNMSDVQAMLYSLIGSDEVRTSKLKKLLMKHGIVETKRTSDRRVKDWLFMGELKKVSRENRDFKVSLF